MSLRDSVLRESLMKKSTPLPTDIIPFILENLSGFDVMLEDGERIVITPKAGATIAPHSRKHLVRAVAPQAARGPVPPMPKPILKPKFLYRVNDRQRTPAQAKLFGFSEQRLSVYNAIYNSPHGIHSKDLMDVTGLTHGTVQQILNWLRKQNMISGEPETEQR